MPFPALSGTFHVGGKISTRFRNINLALFVVVMAIIGAAMFFVLQNVAGSVSKNYARLYSDNSVGTLNTYLGGEIALISKAARSNAVMDWFADENNIKKKRAAHEEMTGIIDVLSSDHLYFGIEKTLHEFSVEDGFTVGDMQHFSTLRPDYFDDVWYFNCTASDQDYLLNVDVDKLHHRKRVWLNYKVTRNGETLGVLCTGLEFSQLVEKLFSEYDNETVRGLIMDESGIIHMDSALLGNDNFLHYSIGGEYHIIDEFSDDEFLSAVQTYIGGINGYFDSDSVTTVIELKSGPYQYATIAPITSTTWSVITLYNASSLFNAAQLVPLFVIILVLFILFMVATGIAGARLIFVPFERLMDSIAHTRANTNERIYGTDRQDEIGALARTVQDMRDGLIDAHSKMHYDALTGIYNRRYMEEALNRVFSVMSRSGGELSILMIDIDFFKNYNDLYGHGMGDECLKKVAAALTAGVVREDDFVARYGGEEFIVVLPNTDKNGAHVIANRLLDNVRACEIPHEASAVSRFVTVSIGLTTGVVAHPQKAADYVSCADKALYQSKQRSRNTYTFLPFEPSSNNS